MFILLVTRSYPQTSEFCCNFLMTKHDTKSKFHCLHSLLVFLRDDNNTVRKQNAWVVGSYILHKTSVTLTTDIPAKFTLSLRIRDTCQPSVIAFVIKPVFVMFLQEVNTYLSLNFREQVSYYSRLPTEKCSCYFYAEGQFLVNMWQHAFLWINITVSTKL